MTGTKHKVVVAGTRTFDDYALLCRELDSRADRIAEVVSGCAPGADTLGERWAAEHQVPVTRIRADWKVHGMRAGYLRNLEMAKYGTAAVLFWDGQSKGTKMMRDLALEHLGVGLVSVVRYDKERR